MYMKWWNHRQTINSRILARNTRFFLHFWIPCISKDGALNTHLSLVLILHQSCSTLNTNGLWLVRSIWCLKPHYEFNLDGLHKLFWYYYVVNNHTITMTYFLPNSAHVQRTSERKLQTDTLVFHETKSHQNINWMHAPADELTFLFLVPMPSTIG